MPPTKSKWWFHFLRIDDKSAKCKTCERLVKTSGNTSNLKAHMDKIHPALSKPAACPALGQRPNFSGSGTSSSATVLESEPDNIKVSDGDLPTSLSKHPPKMKVHKEDRDIQHQPSSSKAPYLTVQSTLDESFGILAAHQEGGKRHSLITNAIIYLLCQADLPLSLVEHQAFLKLFKVVAPHYKVPSRKTIKKYVYEKYNSASEVFKSKFSAMESFSLTTDIWTETLQTRSFLGITVHYLEQDNLASCTVGVFEMDKGHTAEYISSIILNILEEWGLKREMLHLVVTDGAANMVKAMDIAFGKKKHVVCFAHLLNLVSYRSVEAVPELALLIDKVKRVVTWFKQSVRASDELRAESDLKLIQSVDTRWNSTYEMIKRFLSLSPILNNIIHHHTSAPSMTSAAENRDLQEVVQLLEPLQAATNQVSGDKFPTVSLAIPIATNLQNKISSFSPTSNVGIKLREAILEAMRKRLMVEHIPALAISTLLDPRWKTLYFREPEATAKAIRELKEMLKNAHSPKGGHARHGHSSDSDSGEAASSFFGDHAKIVQKTWKQRSSLVGAGSDLPDELALYLRSPAEADTSKCPLSFWSSSTGTYPELSKIAKRYLASTTTSVPSERVFSQAGNIINPSRNRMKGETLSKLLFLHSLGEEYFF